MEILHRGTPPAERLWEGTCYSCKSVIRAKIHEIQITHDQREGSFGSAKCPVCKTSMTFYEK